MADVIKTESTLQIVAEFVDGDTRTISIDNPKAAYSEAQFASAVKDFASYCKTNNVLIGDKAGADFSGVKQAQKVAQTVKYLDLNAN